MSRLLKQLHERLEGAGLKPGSPAYEREERRERVDLCKQQKGVFSCHECAYFDHCELIKAHLRDMYSIEQKPEQKPVHFDRSTHNLPEGRAQSACGLADWQASHPCVTRDRTQVTCESCKKQLGL